MPRDYALGIDVGGTNTTLVITDSQHNILWQNRFPTGEAASFNDLINRIRAVALTARAEVPFSAAGAAAAGQINEEGTLVTSPNLPFSGCPLGIALGEALDLPTIVENDVNAAAWGEYQISASPREPFLAVFVGTGIGAGLVQGGNLFRGASGAAAEIGHIPVNVENGEPCGCGNKGCAEAYAGGRGIIRRANDIYGEVNFSTVDEVVAAAADNENVARILADAARYLGAALAAAVNLFNPATLVLGGGVLRAWPDVAPRALAEMDKHLLRPCRQALNVTYSQLGPFAAAAGAAALARALTQKNPPGTR